MKSILLFTALSLATAASVAQGAAPPSQIERYELASVVKSLMIDREKTGFRGDYLSFKSMFSPLREVEGATRRVAGPESFPGKEADFFYIYEARIPLYVRKERLLAENMKDEYLWRVFVAGPRAAPSNVYIMSQWPVGQPAGATYFNAQGLKLDVVSCEKLGGSSTNYNAYYKVSAPGKFPLLLGISKSTGSGGVWYSYEITWYGIKASSLGNEAEIGLCQVND